MKIKYKERYTALYNKADVMICELKGMRTLSEMINYYKEKVCN